MVIDGVVAEHHLVLHRQLAMKLDAPSPFRRWLEPDIAEVVQSDDKRPAELGAHHPGRRVPVRLDLNELLVAVVGRSRHVKFEAT